MMYLQESRYDSRYDSSYDSRLGYLSVYIKIKL